MVGERSGQPPQVGFGEPIESLCIQEISYHFLLQLEFALKLDQVKSRFKKG